VTEERDLDWPGCFNVRDLGGLPAAGGRETRRGAVVRADSLERLTEAGWAALLDHGVRTVLDLRNDAERGPDVAPRPESITTLHLPLDGSEDKPFWKGVEETPQFGTPLYYRAHVMRKPELSARVLAAIAGAQPGGVAFHCVAGRDRSGQIAMLVLSIAGVAPAVISEDYELSHQRLTGLFAELGEADQGAELKAYLAARGTTGAQVIEATLASLDVEGLMSAGGLTRSELEALRERLLAPAQ
jgi:protein tyrosine/serine phosphatase